MVSVNIMEQLLYNQCELQVYQLLYNQKGFNMHIESKML